MTRTASTVTRFEIVSGIITTKLLDLLQVVVRPAHQLTGVLAVVVREVQTLQVGEHAGRGVRPRPTALPEREYRRKPVNTAAMTPAMTIRTA